MFTEGIQYQKTIIMVTVQCCSCGVVFGMPSDLNERFKDDPTKMFSCPNGHEQHYSKSKSQREIDKLKRDLEDTQDLLAQKEATAIQLEGQLKSEKRKLKRLEKGVCHCCNRSFVNLKRHIETKHPELAGKKK